MRKLLILFSFFVGTPLIILGSLIFYSYMTYNRGEGDVLGESTRSIAYAALPPSENIIQNSIEQKDSKEEILRQFFARYGSPLEPYSADIVAAADRYDMDWRLIPAIAMQESTLCKKIIKDSYNCWGFGIYGTKVTKFSNYPEAIETVTKTLATKYKSIGLVTPEEIEKLYTPSSNGVWASKVSLVMRQLQ